MSYRLGETIDAWMHGVTIVAHLGPVAIADYILGLAEGQDIVVHDVQVRPWRGATGAVYVTVYHTDMYPIWRQWQHVAQTAFTVVHSPQPWEPWHVWLNRINAWQEKYSLGMPTNVGSATYDTALEGIRKATGYTPQFGDIWVNQIHDSLSVGYLTRAGEFAIHRWLDAITDPPVPEGFRL